MNTQKRKAIGARLEAVGDEGFRVCFVLDGAEVGGGVGVGEAKGLEVVGVEGAAVDGEADVVVSVVLAFGEGGGGEGGCC